MKDLGGAAIDRLLAEADALRGQDRYTGMPQASSRGALDVALDDADRACARALLDKIVPPVRTMDA